MAITRNDNLDIRAPKPVDKRMEVLLFEELIKIKYVYYGQLTYVINDNQTFRCLTKDGVKPTNLEDGRTLIPVDNQLWVLEVGGSDPACCLDDIYTSNIPGTRPLPEKVGGFKAGTLLNEYLGLTFSELFDILLFPENLKGSISVIPSVGSVEITGGQYEVRYTIFASPENPVAFNWMVQKTDKNGIVTMIDQGDQNVLPNNFTDTQVYDAVKGEVNVETYDLVIQEPSQPERVLSRATFNINVLLTSITGNINVNPSSIIVKGIGTYDLNYSLNITPSTPNTYFWKVEKTDKSNVTTILTSGDETNYSANTLVQDYSAVEGEKSIEVYRLKVDENKDTIWRNVSTTTFTIDVSAVIPDGMGGVINAAIFFLDENNPDKIDTEAKFLNRSVPNYLDTNITPDMLTGNSDISLPVDDDLIPPVPPPLGPEPLHGVYEIPKVMAPSGVKILSSLGDITEDYMKIDGINRNTWIYIFDGPQSEVGEIDPGDPTNTRKITPIRLLKN